MCKLQTVAISSLCEQCCEQWRLYLLILLLLYFFFSFCFFSFCSFYIYAVFLLLSVFWQKRVHLQRVNFFMSRISCKLWCRIFLFSYYVFLITLSTRSSAFSTLTVLTSCRRAAATICPRPGLQQNVAAAALSQAGRAWPDQPIRTIQPAGRIRRPPTGCTQQTSDRQTSDRQTDRRQTASSLNAAWAVE